ncbi:MAG: putative bifunctional diguanylate cyclase/phosphodiesterase [Janthinobacterium lividum]
MSGSLNHAAKAPQPKTAALSEMATAVLILSEDHEVEYVNASAETLFMPIEPVGSTLPALFASCGATGGDIFDAAGKHSHLTRARIRLVDHRLLDGTLRSLSSGGFVMSLDDVTNYVRDAELALRDGLTGLANRSEFRAQLAERIKLANETGQSVAVLCVDLDRFKAVNDTLGHPIGDGLLRKVADRLKAASREGDLVARLGGDEFAVIQSGGLQPDAAIAMATRLVNLIGRTYTVDGEVLHIGASIGVALSPENGFESDVLLKNADLALYRAKAEGRGCYRFFEPGMNDRMQMRRSLEVDLRRALAFKELQLVYQPQVSITTNAIVGFEALIRWHHPTRGLVSPADFIPLAEDIDLIIPIGEWVLRTACRQAAVWPAGVSIAVNLSPVQFRGGKLVEMVRAALKQSGLSASRLDLEITEGALLEEAGAVVKAFEELKAIGVRFSLDDFGTGYSSLSYLRKFPFTKIKIDQSFVRDIDGDPVRRSIVRAVTHLASALGMQTTAEGVETPAELECVRAEGCNQVQGYLTGRPLSAEAATALLASLASSGEN